MNLSGTVRDDKTSLSLDFCDSNETSADFLTPINEMPPPGCEIEDLPKHNGTESVDSFSNDNDLETQTESAPRKLYIGKLVHIDIQVYSYLVQNPKTINITLTALLT